VARQYLPFVDWMKTIGLALIVYGHVAMRTSPLVVPPVYQKQLGVAFFVFAMGFTLARERRRHWRVVYNRVFEVWMMGLLFALLMSAIGLKFWGDANESNYLPLSGITSFYMNDFPANPTTWYIGTYIHLLLMWALVLRRVRITSAGLFALATSEIVVRAVLIAVMGRYSAYMFLGNWITLLALGMWMGQHERLPALRSRWSAVIVLLTLAIGWPVAARQIPWRLEFPFMDVAPGTWTGLFVVSVCASAVYFAYTIATYAVARTLPASAVARFFARNTVVVFIAHMPVYYLMQWTLVPITSYAVRVTLEFFVCFVVLAVVSEGLRAVLRPDLLRERLGAYLAPVLDGATRASRVAATGSVRL
jgi:Acyltransferase family